MKYELILSDFDWTLYDHSVGYIPQETIDVINKFKAMGGKFHLCTGRMFMAILPFAHQMGLKGEIVCYNGAAIYDIESQQVIKQFAMDKSIVVDMIRFCEQRDIVCQCYINDTLVTQKQHPYIDNYVDYCKAAYMYTGEKLSDYVSKCKDDVVKFLMYTEKLEELRPQISAIVGDKAIITASSDLLIELVAHNAGKHQGVKYFEQKYNIPREKILAFGDQKNDMSMLEYAGTGVAVESSHEDVKSVAQYVAKDPKYQGVALMIKKLLNI